MTKKEMMVIILLTFLSILCNIVLGLGVSQNSNRLGGGRNE